MVSLADRQDFTMPGAGLGFTPVPAVQTQNLDQLALAQVGITVHLEGASAPLATPAPAAAPARSLSESMREGMVVITVTPPTAAQIYHPSTGKKAMAVFISFLHQLTMSLATRNEIQSKTASGSNDLSIRMWAGNVNNDWVKGLYQQGETWQSRLIYPAINVVTGFGADCIAFIFKPDAPVFGETTALALINAVNLTSKEVTKALAKGGRKGKAALVALSASLCFTSAVVNRLSPSEVVKLFSTSSFSGMISKVYKEVAGSIGKDKVFKIWKFPSFKGRTAALVGLNALAFGMDVLPLAFGITPSDTNQNKIVTATTGISLLTSGLVYKKLNKGEESPAKPLSAPLKALRGALAILEKGSTGMKSNVMIKLEEAIASLESKQKSIKEASAKFEKQQKDAGKRKRDVEQMVAHFEEVSKPKVNSEIKKLFEDIQGMFEFEMKGLSEASPEAHKKVDEALNAIEKQIKAIDNPKKHKATTNVAKAAGLSCGVALGVLALKRVAELAVTRSPVVNSGGNAAMVGFLKMVEGPLVKAAKSERETAAVVAAGFAGVVGADLLTCGVEAVLSDVVPSEYASAQVSGMMSRSIAPIAIGTATFFGSKEVRKSPIFLFKGYKAAREAVARTYAGVAAVLSGAGSQVAEMYSLRTG